MAKQLLNSKDAADALGLNVLTLYDWLGQSDVGEFVIRGQPVTIEYYQGGRRGQGRIKIDAQEIERLLLLMRVTPRTTYARKRPEKKTILQHITTNLGRPTETVLSGSEASFKCQGEIKLTRDRRRARRVSRHIRQQW